MRERRPALPGLTGLEIIAGFKFLQAATLIVAGLGAFGLMNAGVADAAQEWLERLALGNGHRIAVAAAARTLPFLYAATPRHFGAIGSGAFLYALVFLAEGIGLWRGKRWAEYLTIGVTTSLLPFEAAAVYHRLTLVRVATLAVNVLVVVYLGWQLRARGRLEHAEAASGESADRAVR
ncbi:MAG TPA: DUF2127 domain-containing protein [Gemmatimonadaceae bacterium]|jgi:uncharacterized membrane protein (DUF2068 family)|nr:DUF2127 domain-containing protein [Gemmatimonadaceae bacterium]